MCGKPADVKEFRNLNTAPPNCTTFLPFIAPEILTSNFFYQPAALMRNRGAGKAFLLTFRQRLSISIGIVYIIRGDKLRAIRYFKTNADMLSFF